MKEKILNNLKCLNVPEEKCSAGFALISKYRTAIMGFAALWIYVFHGWIEVCERGIPNLIESRLKCFGYCGVDIFFLLSGMGLTYAIGKTNLPIFYYRRIKRILPPFLVIAIIRMILENWNSKDFIYNITGLGFYTISIYRFLWFVPAIISFYLIFPLYWKLFKIVKPYYWTSCTLLLWMIITLAVNGKLRGDAYGFTNRIPVFCIGVLIGYITQTKRNHKFRKVGWIVLFLVFILGMYMLELTNYGGLYIFVIPFSNCCFPTMFVAVSLPFILAKVLNELECRKGICIIGHLIKYVLIFFGLFSLELYCLQEWYASIVIPILLEKSYSSMQINILLFVQTTLIAYISSVLFKLFWKIIEFLFGKINPKWKK